MKKPEKEIICPHCTNSDQSLIEKIRDWLPKWFCGVCGREFGLQDISPTNKG